MKKEIIIKNIDDDTRIDRWLKRSFSSLSQSFIQNKLRRGLIKVNNKKIKASYKVIAKDIISINQYSENTYFKINKILNKKIVPKEITKKLKQFLIYECKDFLILNKWSGISTQGGSNIIISIDDIIKGISQNYNLVHRLDKETSGLLIIAKNYKATKLFGKLFKEQSIEKIYVAICQGFPQNLDSFVKLGIKSKNKSKNSIQTITKYKVITKSRSVSLIAFKPLTGKTHQLRIVSKYLNSPIIGDSKYNQSKKYQNEQLKLNACYLKFNYNNKEYEFMLSLPEHFIKFTKKNNLSFFLNKKVKNLTKFF